MEMISGSSIAKRMPVDEYGVEDDNFSDVSAMLMDERETLITNLIDKMAKKND